MNELMVVRQLPVIEENLKAVSAEIKERLSIVDALVCSEETVKEVEKLRTDFRREFGQLEEQRKAIKAAVIEPYMRFEAVYNECVAEPYKSADVTMKSKVDSVRSEQRAVKAAEVKAYFDEYATANNVSDYADFNRQMPKVNLSDTMASLKRACKERVDALVSGLAVIDTQPDELKAEILAEFKRTLDATAAIGAVSVRHKAIEEAKARQTELEEKKAATADTVSKVKAVMPLAPPKVVPVDDDPVLELTFTVTAKKSKLKALKQFLVEGAYGEVNSVNNTQRENYKNPIRKIHKGEADAMTFDLQEYLDLVDSVISGNFVELSEEYFEKANERIERRKSQTSLFDIIGESA